MVCLCHVFLLFVCSALLSLFIVCLFVSACVCVCFCVFVCVFFFFGFPFAKADSLGNTFVLKPKQKEIEMPEAISKPPVDFLCLTQKGRTTNV